MCFGLQWQLSFPGKHAFGHRHNTEHTLHVCIIFRQIFSVKNNPWLWHLRQNFSLGLFIAKGPVCSNLVHSPNVWLCFMWVSKKNSVTPQNAPLDSSRNPMVFFFGMTLSKQDFMCIPGIPIPWQLVSKFRACSSSGHPSPLRSNSWGFFVAKNVGVGEISGYHRSPVARLPRPNSWESFVWRAQTNPKFANNEPRTPKVLEQHLRRRKNDCTTHLWIQNSC